MRVRLLALLAMGALSGCGSTGPASMEFVEISPAQPRLGDVVTVRFRLLDSRGVALAGSTVNYKIQGDSSGVSLNPTSSTSIKGTGFAETQIVANSRVASVTIVATSGDKSVTTPPLTFAGSVPNGRQFTFQCGQVAGTASGGIHAINAYDPTRHLVAGVKVNCTAHTGDRAGDGVPNALVSFLTEAGTIGPTETSLSDVVGNATILYKTSLPFPVETDPDVFSWAPANDDTHMGFYLAPLWMHPFEWIENPSSFQMSPSFNFTLKEPRRPDPIRLKPDGTRYENNPRDNLVSMIAVTAGEEGFSDDNNNGKYDMGEPFDDLTEPFVDSNDNGTWDEGEHFIDVNGDGKWNGKNGKWDANALIWVQERLLWTGLPAVEDQQSSLPGQPNLRPVTFLINNNIKLRCPAALPPGSTDCAQATVASGGSATVLAFLADPWFNSMARNGASDGCALKAAGNAPIVMSDTLGSGAAVTYPPGELLSFQVGDARDPNAPPISQVPKRTYPVSFDIPIDCTYTGSPLDGQLTHIYPGSVSGDID